MQNQPVNQQTMAMVYQRLNGKATLEPLVVNNLDTGQQVFGQVQKKLHELSRQESRLYRSALRLTRMEVAIGEIKWVRVEHLRQARSRY